MPRDTLKQSGTAYADYAAAGYSGTFRVFAYDGRGELQTDVRYRGDTPTTAPAATDELPARRFEYRYDAIGNRKTAGATGSANTADDEYSTNALNQYFLKENNTLKVLGTAALSAKVAVGGAAATGKKDRAWGTDLVPPNTSAPVAGTVKAYAALPGAGTGGADIIRTDTRPYTVPAAVQAFSYDEDGNLTSDGVWSYQWDAENRLKQMTTTSAASAGGLAARTLTFQYDYMDRRVQKRVVDGAGAELSSRRYLYDGWNVVAEFLAPGGTSIGTLVRSYTWGLDLVGSRTVTGGVGALLQIADHASGKNYLPAYDSNGNIAALLNASTGDPAAIYEYGPFGEILRATVNDATVADNPWQFSTKFTDSETGLVYYGHRYYSATLGRFINRDPVEESGGVNLYGFCLNDPIDKWDVLGNAPSRDELKQKELEEASKKIEERLRSAAASAGVQSSDAGFKTAARALATTGADGNSAPTQAQGNAAMGRIESAFHLSNNGGNGGNGTTARTYQTGLSEMKVTKTDVQLSDSGKAPNSAATGEITNPADVRNETKTWSKLHDAEKSFVISHPLAALDFRKAADQALTEAQRRFPDPKSLWNGPGDAFRHAYWNALMVQAQGHDLAKQFADAHENFPGNDPREKAMDLFNNAVGRGIGGISDKFPGVPLPDLIDRALRQGQLQTGLKP